MTAEETWARLCPFHFHLLTHQLSLQPLPFLVPLHGWTSEEASKVGIVEPGEYKAWELLFNFFFLASFFPFLKMRKLPSNRGNDDPKSHHLTIITVKGLLSCLPVFFFSGVAVLESYLCFILM